MKRLSLALFLSFSLSLTLGAATTLADAPIVGEIRAYAGTVSLPQGWRTANGANVQTSLYPDLCAQIGNTYGVAPAGYCKLPDLRGRNIIGANGTTFAMGQTGGEQNHTLTVNEIPAHQHDIYRTTSNVWSSGSAIRGLNDSSIGGVNQGNKTELIGGGQAHNVLDPYQAVQYIIYVGGVDAPTPTPTATPLATYTPAATYTPWPTYTPVPPAPTYTPEPTYTPVPPAPTYTPGPTYTPASYTSTTYLPNLSASYTHTLRSGKTLTQPVEMSFGQLIVASLGLAVIAALVLPFVFGVVFRK